MSLEKLYLNCSVLIIFSNPKDCAFALIQAFKVFLLPSFNFIKLDKESDLIFDASDIDESGWKRIVLVVLIAGDSRQHHRHVLRCRDHQLTQLAARH